MQGLFSATPALCGCPLCAALEGLFWHIVQAITELNMMMERQKFTEVAWRHLTAAANLVIFHGELSRKRTHVVSLRWRSCQRDVLEACCQQSTATAYKAKASYHSCLWRARACKSLPVKRLH